MKKFVIILIGLVMFVLLVPSSPTQAGNCDGLFSGNAFVTDCNATPVLNSFTSDNDLWGIYQRPPTSANDHLFDDSVSTSGTDSFGIIQSGYVEQFFGIEDLNNGDNPSGTGELVLIFDISGAGTLSDVSIDFGAMGDFEPADTYSFKYSIDGGSETTIFSATADESISLLYTLEFGNTNTLLHPLKISMPNGGSCASSTTLSNILQTCTATVSGSGLLLTLTFDAENNSNEIVVFDHIIINGSGVDPTAITMNSLTLDNTNNALPMVFVGGALLLLISSGLLFFHRNRKAEHSG